MDLSLSARFSAALNASFGTAVGMDILGFAARMMGETATANADYALEAAGSGSAERNDDLAAILGKALADNVFFLDMGLSVDLDAEATKITDEAVLWLVGVRIVTEGDRHALTAMGDFATTAGEARAVDADSYVLQNDEQLSQIFIQLGDGKLGA